MDSWLKCYAAFKCSSKTHVETQVPQWLYYAMESSRILTPLFQEWLYDKNLNELPLMLHHLVMCSMLFTAQKTSQLVFGFLASNIVSEIKFMVCNIKHAIFCHTIRKQIKIFCTLNNWNSWYMPQVLQSSMYFN